MSCTARHVHTACREQALIAAVPLACLCRRDGDAEHWPHHPAELQDLFHQAAHCARRARGKPGKPADREALQCMPRLFCRWCARWHEGVQGSLTTWRMEGAPAHARGPGRKLRSPVSMGMAKPMPEEAPLPVGSAMAVLMPMSRPAGSVRQRDIKPGQLGRRRAKRGHAGKAGGRMAGALPCLKQCRQHAWGTGAAALASMAVARLESPAVGRPSCPG